MISGIWGPNIISSSSNISNISSCSSCSSSSSNSSNSYQPTIMLMIILEILGAILGRG